MRGIVSARVPSRSKRTVRHRGAGGGSGGVTGTGYAASSGCSRPRPPCRSPPRAPVRDTTRCSPKGPGYRSPSRAPVPGPAGPGSGAWCGPRRRTATAARTARTAARTPLAPTRATRRAVAWVSPPRPAGSSLPTPRRRGCGALLLRQDRGEGHPGVDDAVADGDGALARPCRVVGGGSEAVHDLLGGQVGEARPHESDDAGDVGGREARALDGGHAVRRRDPVDLARAALVGVRRDDVVAGGRDVDPRAGQREVGGLAGGRHRADRERGVDVGRGRSGDRERARGCSGSSRPGSRRGCPRPRRRRRPRGPPARRPR